MEVNAVNSLKYAVKKVEFYKRREYEEAAKKVNKSNLDTILSTLPIIDGSSFYEDNFSRFLTSDDSYYMLFMTSGSTGKPKIMPYTAYSSQLYAKTVLDMYEKIIGARPLINISFTPPKPAISGAIVSKICEIGNIMEIVPGPGQTILDVLRYSDNILKNHGSTNRYVLIQSITSLLLRDLYNLSDKDKEELKNISSRMKLFVVSGGETFDLNRAKIIASFLDLEGIIDLIASTEGASGYRFYSKEDIASNNRKDFGFKMNTYNSHYSLYKDGKIIPINRDSVGLEGELLVTSKSGKNKPISPLINYNMKEKVKVLSVDNGLVLDFLGRTNKVVGFGVSKLMDNIIDDVIAGAVLNFKIGEGYAEIVRENGLDKLQFHFYRDSSKAEADQIKEYLMKSLSSKEMEIDYTLRNNLGSVSVDFVDKEKVPFYVQKGKATRLIDNRNITHY